MEKEVAFLALTIAAEFPVAMFVLRKREWQQILVAVTSVNFITHPIAWHFVTHGSSWFSVEVAVTIFEAVILTKILPLHPLLLPLGRRRVFTAGVAMNVVSALIGVLLF